MAPHISTGLWCTLLCHRYVKTETQMSKEMTEAMGTTSTTTTMPTTMIEAGSWNWRRAGNSKPGHSKIFNHPTSVWTSKLLCLKIEKLSYKDVKKIYGAVAQLIEHPSKGPRPLQLYWRGFESRLQHKVVWLINTRRPFCETRNFLRRLGSSWKKQKKNSFNQKYSSAHRSNRSNAIHRRLSSNPGGSINRSNNYN